MKKKAILLLFISLLAIICLAVPAWANATPALVVNSPANVDIDENFSVSINVNDVSGLAGVQFDLAFDPGKLEVLSMTSGNIFTGAIEAPNTWDNELGKVQYGAAVIPPQTYEGSGVALTVNFKAKAEGVSPLTLSDTILGATGGLQIDHTATSASVTIGNPPPPVTPELKVISPASVNAGNNFSVSINVNDVSGLAGVQFDLAFDPGKLEVLSMTSGNIFTGAIEAPNTWDNELGKVQYGAAVIPPQTYEGSGVALTVNFKAKAEGVSPLTLSDTILGATGGLQIEHTVTSGSVTINPGPPPYVISHVPTSNATNVEINTPVSATFNRDITLENVNGASIMAGGTPVTGVTPITLSPDNRTITIPHNVFANNTVYTVTISAGTVAGASDAAENETISWTFTTKPECLQPQVVSRTPSINAVNVDLNAPVSATFGMDISEDVNFNEITITAGGATVEGVNPTLASDNRTINIAHNELDYNTTYTVNIPAGAVINECGQNNGQISWNFTTRDQDFTADIELVGDNINPDRPLTINGTANKNASWQINVKDSNGEVVESYPEESGTSISLQYTPEMDLPVVAQYTVEATATPSEGTPIVITKTFNIYNYPLKITSVAVSGSGASRTVTAAVANLGETDMANVKGICQITETDNGEVSVVSLEVNTVNVPASGATLQFNMDAPATGNYQVEVYIWSSTETGWVTLGQNGTASLVI